ncbi:hypothetical protein V5F79_22355 [Xanthobacter flavus]|uniref:hypothetical protein n=1 Tax=Xanthobacter flavus TaxID=281 RepID=UPI00372843C4
MSTEAELDAAREWLRRLLEGVTAANSAAEAVALAAFRQHGPRAQQVPTVRIMEAAE